MTAGELPAWTDPRLLTRLGVEPSTVLDVYPDTVAQQLVVRLAGGERRRLTLAPAVAVRASMRRPALAASR